MDSARKNGFYKWLVTIFHFIAAIQFSYSVYYDYTFVVVPKEVFPIMSAFGGKFKFLTFWDAVMQSLYFIICTFIDLFISEPSHSSLVKVKDFIHSSLAFPVAMFVGVTFWGLYAVDRELVLPSKLDPYFPTWLNHIMHTNIMFFTLLELLLTYRKYPSRSKALTALIVFQLTYISWMHYVHYQSGFWVYNVFNVLNLPQRAAFIVGCVLLACGFYFLGEKINSVVWERPKRRKGEEVPMP
ncbi:androgen-induced gene 1 protein-like isoform X2 [Macrosteles quadrilineatus]|uniref:androgen-induced gene 1 protein-like isoform X2 n=1 Tax=Macrosteles quadrilineatus TaxID=74068 RepID=UPI0023E10A8C|nr:androgen-induced gene 1 protein-like isoform X2 [Macrosteles quadrilineatus]